MSNRDDSEPEEDWGDSTTPWQEPQQTQQPQQPQVGGQPTPPTQPWTGGPTPPPVPPQQPWQGAQPPPPPSAYPPSQYQPWPQPRPTINNYMVPAVLATIFCFFPTGIPAIVYANQVNNKLNSGDVYGAQKASDNAKMWMIVTVVVGAVFVFFFIAASSGSA
jgi:hypothetical protein